MVEPGVDQAMAASVSRQRVESVLDVKGRVLTRFGTAIRASGRTAVFFLKVLPVMPSKLVDWVTPEPEVERVRYPGLDGIVEGELYRPGGAGPYPGVVVCLGVVPFGVDHPQVPRLGSALARAGFATLLFWSPAMRDLRLEPEDSRRIALAYRWLIDQPFIDAERSGLLGTCVGGSFALLAAADLMIQDRVGFVVTWAPFASLRSLAHDIAAATTSSAGETRPWDVDQLTRKVYVRSLTALLEPDEAERMRTACAERNGEMAQENLSADGRTVYPLLTALDLAHVDEALARLPVRMQQWVDAMSPVDCLPSVRAPLISLAHDRDDAVIPIGESRRLMEALHGRAGVRYTEFTMFKHMDPTRIRLGSVAVVVELGRFVRFAYPMFRWSVEPGVQSAGHPATRDRLFA
jgi:dienelactone hydrolase